MKELTDQLLSEKERTDLQALQLKMNAVEKLLFKCLALLKEKHDRVFTDKELAERYNVHTATIREWRKNGLKSKTTGKNVFILESDFIEWVAGERI